jgi:hypothetical protein
MIDIEDYPADEGQQEEPRTHAAPPDERRDHESSEQAVRKDLPKSREDRMVGAGDEGPGRVRVHAGALGKTA